MKHFGKSDYTKINSLTWDAWAKDGCPWTLPITHEEFLAAKAGACRVYLTPCRFVPEEWFGSLCGKKLLGLASGGGQQMPVFAANGAECTVFDYSDSQLEKERIMAEREGYAIEIIKGDMTKPLPFADDSFDLIFHPVSNCYIREIEPVWRECFRILKPGGRLLAGFDNGLNFLFDEDGTLPLIAKNKLPYDPIAMSDEEFASQRDNLNAIQFSHSLEEQLGGQLRAGFILRDLYEDRDREGCGHLREYAPQYMATLAIKPC
ncbi:MAG: class I SAM-dependent methyltransferase [Ruminococcaceae bacterium]|nr:class I SAM-dependent methyltransferase [Oscillospiraceae bacterium]